MDHDIKEPKAHPKSILEFSKEEREYLHDVANPLAIASGMLEALREDFERSEVKLSESQLRKMTKVQTALDRITALIRSRRARMIEIQDANGSASETPKDTK